MWVAACEWVICKASKSHRSDASRITYIRTVWLYVTCPFYVCSWILCQYKFWWVSSHSQRFTLHSISFLSMLAGKDYVTLSCHVIRLRIHPWWYSLKRSFICFMFEQHWIRIQNSCPDVNNSVYTLQILQLKICPQIEIDKLW